MGLAYNARSALIRLLVDNDSVEYLVREGLDLEAVPGESARPIVEWTIKHFMRTNKAPTIPEIEHTWGEVISDLDIDMEIDPDESMEKCIDVLKDEFVMTKLGEFASEALTEVRAAGIEGAEGGRVAALEAASAKLAALTVRIAPRSTAVDMRAGLTEMWAEYEAVEASGHPVRGMTFGLPEVDSYTRGIWDEELCTIIAPTKQKKSWFVDYIAYQEWKRGRICALFTLENSIKMTLQRIACVACNVSISELMDGKLDSDDREKVRWWVHDVYEKSDVPLPILSPDSDGRTPEAMVARARAHGADEAIFDQLSHMSFTPERGRRYGRPDEIREMVQGLDRAISTGRRRMPGLLVHQINREGIQDIEKTGTVKSYRGSDGAEVERSSAFEFALFSTAEQALSGRASLVPVAVRRTAPHPGWELNWAVDLGLVSVRGELRAA